MSSFHARLVRLLDAATDKKIIEPAAAATLLEMARQDESPGRMGKLAVSIAVLGGLGLSLGVILIFAANWQDIPDWSKLTGLLLLFAVSHAGGLCLRRYKPDYPATAEMLTFLGGALFLAGLALVSQIYHINEDPARGLMAWLLATLPLALLLRSVPLTGMAMVAALSWGHLVYYRQPHVWQVEVGTSAMFETLVAVVLLGLAPLLGRLKDSLKAPLETTATIMLAVVIYLLGFFRHIDSELGGTRRGGLDDGWAANHILMLVGVAVVFALACCLLRPGLTRWRRLCLFSLLAASIALAGIASGLWMGVIDPGDAVDIFSFGRYRYDAWHTRTFALTAAAWVLWFVWCLWLIFDGGLSGDGATMAAGVYGFGIGVVTRFIDLVGTLLETGVAFVIGGIVLIVVGIGVEKWRRILKKRMDLGKPLF